MNYFCRFIILFIVTHIFESVAVSERTCSVHLVDHECPDPNESCNQQKISDSTGVCKCKTGYTKRSPTELCMQIKTVTTTGPHSDDMTTTPEPEYSSKISGSTVATSILIPLLLVVASVGLVYAARRYRWLHKLHHLRQRRYDEVRIGQEDDDDPPIA
ncbi:hypothetical protein B7P43_G10469 [Cryptotermes secundus]|uniref:EGF-like domain-containing protein n=1 Tax=Cryptotermes secundus TaxID=105785 RepID=A0A2J7QL11_9NEOP|nr:uncharacterized protein LOC111866855 [Cryptotermes secundus]PNF29270.1 hypothetical protein B7P43_G10469 [Cryptotermes secundus]